MLLLKWAWPTPVRGPPAKALQQSAPVTTMEVTTTLALPAPLRPSTEYSMTREAGGPIKDRLLGKLGNSTSWMCELLLSFIQLLAIHLAGRALFKPPSTLPPMARSPTTSLFFSTARCITWKQGHLKKLHPLRISSRTPMHELEILRLDSVTKSAEFAHRLNSTSATALHQHHPGPGPYSSSSLPAFACTYPIHGTPFAPCGST